MVTKKHIEDRPGLNRAGVYVIYDYATGDYAGKLLYAHPNDGAGILYASLWDFTEKHNATRDIQNGRATGCGYDKQSAAIDGMSFGSGERAFKLQCDGTGMNSIIDQFKQHGYILQWVI